MKNDIKARIYFYVSAAFVDREEIIWQMPNIYFIENMEIKHFNTNNVRNFPFIFREIFMKHYDVIYNTMVNNNLLLDVKLSVYEENPGDMIKKNRMGATVTIPKPESTFILQLSILDLIRFDKLTSCQPNFIKLFVDKLITLNHPIMWNE